LLTDIDAYFASLGAYRDGDPMPIVERRTSNGLPTQHSQRWGMGDNWSRTCTASAPTGRNG